MQRLDIEWFSLAKYESLRNMSLLEIYGQLYIRKELYQMIFHSRTGNKSAKESVMEQNFTGWIDQIRNKSIIDTCIQGSENSKQVNEEDLALDTVTDLTALDVQGLISAARVTFDDDDEELSLEELDVCLDELTHQNHPNEELGYRHLKIDIFASDELILRHFRNWLSEIRTKYPKYTIEKSFSEQDKAKWVHDRLIPYIDLRLITAYDNIKLTDYEIGNLVLYDYTVSSPEARVRRTLKKKAEYLMKDETINTLALQLGIPPSVG